MVPEDRTPLRPRRRTWPPHNSDPYQGAARATRHGRSAARAGATPQRTATALPQIPATARRTVALALPQATAALSTTTTISPTVRSVAAAPTVQVVDPASVQLPQAGPLLLLNPNMAALGGTINVIGSGFDGGKLITLTLTLPGTKAADRPRHRTGQQKRRF